MALEAGDGFISGLVATNPVNATDQVAQGDDHVRLIKTALQGTFPNLNGAVTATPAELNILDGATLSTAELNILDGVTLTAAQINDAARLSAANTYTSTALYESATPRIEIRNSGAASGLKRWILEGESDGDLSIYTRTDAGSVVETGFQLKRNSSAEVTQATLTADEVELNGAIDINGAVDISGTLTTPNLDAAEVGFKGAPQNAQNGNYTLVLTDAGKSIDKASGGAGETITIPANASVAFPVGTIICGDNDGGGDLTIAITSDTLEDSAGNTGSRTVADNGSWQIKKISSTKWRITGSGIS